ncbi:MAG TPA: glycosyltransferase [Terrimicrobiaceae bacterium]
MMEPAVSVCLPTLNSRRFLAERLESIRRQTCTDWEIIAVDSHSEDGTLELLQQLAREDARIRLHHAPADGIYPNINRCVSLAQAPHIYIATSDDTMAPDCLEKLVAALQTHGDCDLAHCELRIIDEQGCSMPDWWSKTSIFARSSGSLLHQMHIRRAPFDGLLHLVGAIVYTSLTQLLIRRSLFTRVGLFKPHWGSIGDFNWNMRACLVANTVHVPNTWGGFRIHASQATAAVNFGSSEHLRRINEMIEDALRSSKGHLSSRIGARQIDAWLNDAREMRGFLAELRNVTSSFQRKLFLLALLLAGKWTAREHVKERLHHRPAWPSPKLVQSWLTSAGILSPLVPTES